MIILDLYICAETKEKMTNNSYIRNRIWYNNGVIYDTIEEDTRNTGYSYKKINK